MLDRDYIPGYRFTSVEVKEKAFRFDGIFTPPTDDLPLYFVEVQFQYNPNFYRQLLSEIFLFLNQQNTSQDWVAVPIFPTRAVDVKQLSAVEEEMVSSGRIRRIYLDELWQRSTPEWQLLELITCPESRAQEVVRDLQAKTRDEVILDFVSTILLYKFPRLSRKEIEQMFSLDDLRKTRVVQEVEQESLQRGREQGLREGLQQGQQVGELQLLQKQISKKFGVLPPDRSLQLQGLDIPQLELLGEALLDLATIDEFYSYLDQLTSSP